MANPSGAARGGRGLIIGLVVVIVVIAIIAGLGWGLYITKKTPKAALTSSEESSILTAMAYEHWDAIGLENITQTMSQYAPNATLYWYVHSNYAQAYNSALNGTYHGTTAIKTIWSKFYQESVVYYWANKVSVKVSNGTATVTAILWYIISNGTVNQSAPVSSQLYTVIMPYELYYVQSGGSWQLQAEWWGFPSRPGSLIPGAYGLEAYITQILH
ncbi:MAG: hypothetical protein QXP70_04110 [Methanomassiliicoccales archaeon]